MDEFEGMLSIERALVEHNLIPDQLFKDPATVVAGMAKVGANIMYEMFDSMMPGKYKREQFFSRAYPNKERGFSVILVQPAPEKVIDCSLIGIKCGYKGINPKYYTMELGEDGEYFLCVKTNKDSHAILDEECGRSLKEQMLIMLKYLEV